MLTFQPFAILTDNLCQILKGKESLKNFNIENNKEVELITVEYTLLKKNYIIKLHAHFKFWMLTQCGTLLY